MIGIHRTTLYFAIDATDDDPAKGPSSDEAVVKKISKSCHSSDILSTLTNLYDLQIVT